MHEPPFLTFCEDTFPTRVSAKIATETAIKQMQPDDTFISPGKTTELKLPPLMPLPLSWVPYFLEKRRSNRKATMNMSKKIAKWIDVYGGKVGHTIVMGWFRATCTNEPG
jgi:hypothetical protein